MWYNPFYWIERAKGYFSRGETPEATGLNESLAMHRKLMRDVYAMTHEPAQRETRDPRRLEAEFQRRIELHERAQRVRKDNHFIMGLRVNHLPPFS